MANYIEQIRKDLENIELTDQDMLKDKHRFTHLKAEESRFACEGKHWYLGWRSNPQLKNGGYWKAFGQLTKKDARDKENCLYGSMTLYEYETEEEYNKALIENGLKTKESRKFEAYTNVGEVEVEYNYTTADTSYFDIRQGTDKKYRIYGNIEGNIEDFNIHFDFEVDDLDEAKRIIADRLAENEINLYETDFKLFDRPTTFNERGGDAPQSLYEYLGEYFAKGFTDSLDLMIDLQTALSVIAFTLDQLNPVDVEKINKRAPKIAKAISQLTAPYEYDVQGVARLFRDLGKEDKRLSDAVDDALDRLCDIQADSFEGLINSIKNKLPDIIKEALNAQSSLKVLIEQLGKYGQFKANKAALKHQIDKALKEDITVANKILDLVNQEWPKGVQMQKWGQGLINYLKQAIEDRGYSGEYRLKFSKDDSNTIEYYYEIEDAPNYGSIIYNPYADEYKVTLRTFKDTWDASADKLADIPTELVKITDNPYAIISTIAELADDLDELHDKVCLVDESNLEHIKQIRKDVESIEI